ncbi:trimethylamine monooxygenase-like [Tubulanus polymorphus]|uniref:trimethylamine monooxygenase-like n=1 Tax=Tubulanus polymorphus TaxID=672921 RepID=UPI003DA5A0A2
MSSSKKRVCVIGAGPSGMSFLCHLEKLRLEGVDVPDVVCIEKQSNWGGLWNTTTWRTGLDENGENVHSPMYKQLVANSPKELSFEFHDYSFEEHFGKPVPSFLPRDAIFDYLNGRWNMKSVRRFIKFETVAHTVTYNPNSDDFTVVMRDVSNDLLLPVQTFDFVINATGHFSYPNIPHYEGFETFPGRILHTVEMRDMTHLKDQNVLIVGGNLSADDTSLQLHKYGASSIIISYRHYKQELIVPENITTRPILTKVVGKTVHFKDGTTADVDTIILATGYKHHYPYMDNDLKLKSANLFYPDNLYKGTLWMKSANNRLFYIGAQDQLYSFTMFDAQALWALRVIIGDIKLPTREAMQADIKHWRDRMEAELSPPKCTFYSVLEFQTEYILDIADEAKYGYNLDGRGIMLKYLPHFLEKPYTGSKDYQARSNVTGKIAPPHHTDFLQNFDLSLQSYLNSR